MRWSRTFQLLDVHCEGEIGRIMTGGQPVIAGSNIYEKFKTLSYDPEMQAFRKMLVLEPRGAAAGSTNLIFPPDDPQNHAGFIVLQPDQAHAMSGSNAICTTTALLETGMIEMNEGENLVRLETAAGLVIIDGITLDSGALAEVALVRPWGQLDVGELTVLCFSGGMVCLGFFCLAQAYRMAEVSLLASWEYTSLLWGGLWGYIFFNEIPSALTLVGAVIIVASGVYVARR